MDQSNTLFNSIYVCPKKGGILILSNFHLDLDQAPRLSRHLTHTFA